MLAPAKARSLAHTARKHPPPSGGIGWCHAAQGQGECGVCRLLEFAAGDFEGLRRAAPLHSRERGCVAAAGMAGGGHGGQGFSPAAAVAQPLGACCSGAVVSGSPGAALLTSQASGPWRSMPRMTTPEPSICTSASRPPPPILSTCLCCSRICVHLCKRPVTPGITMVCRFLVALHSPRADSTRGPSALTMEPAQHPPSLPPTQAKGARSVRSRCSVPFSSDIEN